MADKPVRLPWEETRYIDPKAATQRAIAAAQPRAVDLKSAAVVSYARSGFDREIAAIANAPVHERQKTLFPSAAALFELVAAGVLDETTVYNAIRDACRTNMLEQDDGERSVELTIRNARRRGFDNPRDLSRVGTKARNGFDLDVDKPEEVRLADVYDLERGFWTSRDSLRTIYLGALARMCSPWAVFGHCAARALALVRPNCVLPPIVGGPGSLNWFCAVAAQSGGGKSSAAAVAAELIKEEVRQRNLGSGEGVIDAFIKPGDKKTGEPPGQYESVMFVADEVDGMAALTQRSGNTLSSVLREAFTGGTLGFSYRTSSNAHLERHSYRMTLLINVQPARAGSLLDDKHGGTLQRFLWLPGTDPRVTTEIPSMPAPLTLPPHSAWQFPRELRIPYEATELIRDERARNQQGGSDDSEGHSLFIREKLAFALAVLDGRDEMELEDWMLAGTVSRISAHTRKWVAAELIRITEEEAFERGRLQGVSLSASNEERVYRDTQRLVRIATWVMKRISTDGATQRELTQAIAGRDRPYLPTALERLQQAGRIEHNELKRWVKTKS